MWYNHTNYREQISPASALKEWKKTKSHFFRVLSLSGKEPDRKKRLPTNLRNEKPECTEICRVTERS